LLAKLIRATTIISSCSFCKFINIEFPNPEYKGLIDDLIGFGIITSISTIIRCVTEKGVRILKLDFKIGDKVPEKQSSIKILLTFIEAVLIHYIGLIMPIDYAIVRDETQGTICFDNGSQLTVMQNSLGIENKAKEFDYVFEWVPHKTSFIIQCTKK
jgi:hypothetical protein